MEVFESYMVFIVGAMATITLVTCVDDDDQQSNNDTSTIIGNYDYDHQKFYNKMLELHNKARDIHDAEPMLLNEDLCKEATDYLKNVIDGKVQLIDMYFNDNLYVSENIEQETAEYIFYHMYNEGRNYDFKQESEFKTASSFTQMVWKSTKEVGFAFVYTDKINYFSTIYKPIGNVAGEYIMNVGEPKYDRRTIFNILYS